ncbi:GNAT family N-acetyltransferase [Vagococcus luciliae]|uniref:Ribosomal N-acetyltransferase YdaF n=1 Tax=Vagococcus luciliae TaxID=2920380 RepID=A0ABY5P0B2_9ENTE|nr:GNAT family protein [Vagococcus luciliae]UUV99249.1 Putative ribosomal N-acetyltransferase YdaF [Vagococcus luciliae]
MFYFKLPVNSSIDLVKPDIHMAEEFFLLIRKNQKHLETFLDFVALTNVVKDSEHFITHSIKQESEQKELVLFIITNTKIIGCIDLHNINKTHKKAEIGYWLDSDYTGKGIMSDCVNCLIDIAFTNLDLNKLVILAEETNVASNQVAKKVGFHLDGIEREDIFRQNHFVNLNKYSLLKSEYLNTKKD